MAMISQGDFVIMTFDQMDEFDAFKQCEYKQEYSYLKKESHCKFSGLKTRQLTSKL